MTVVTSNHKYDILSFCELTEKQQEKARKKFDWIEDIEDSYGYFVFKKEVYNLGSFMRHKDFLTDEKSGKKFYAHGIYSWGYFNGLAVEFVDRDSAVKVAYYYS
jgi:hypothetical protein